ncbi:MAG: YdcF family protein [Pseudomonadota bacterium]
MRLLRRLAGVALRLGAVVLAVTYGAVLAAERHALATYAPERLEPVDVVIVLGGGIDPDWRQNYVGRGRTDTAAAVLAADRARIAIFTGTAGDDVAQPRGEGGIMADAVAATGIAPERLVIEPAARTTLENLTLAFAIGDARGATTYAILTDAYHLPRAMALAGLLDREVSGVAAPNFADANLFLRLGYVLREALAWWYNLGKAAAWYALGAAGVSEAERAGRVW